MHLNGDPEDPPAAPGAEQGYHMGSLAALAGSLLAIVGRERGTSGGRKVEVSLQEAAAMATLQTANANYWSWHRTAPGRAGNRFVPGSTRGYATSSWKRSTVRFSLHGWLLG